MDQMCARILDHTTNACLGCRHPIKSIGCLHTAEALIVLLEHHVVSKALNVSTLV